MQSIDCLVKKPLEIRVNDRKDLGSGVIIIDVANQNGQNFDFGSIQFRNNYTAFITIKVKCKIQDKAEIKWTDCVRDFRLMPDPHTEGASQDYFTISRSQMLFNPEDVSTICLVLLQPSPVWAHFGIECISVYPPESESPSTLVSSWLDEHQNFKQDPSSNKEACRKGTTEKTDCVDHITAGVQHLWALTETMRNRHTQESLGRYDIDGSYEINLLSYT